MSDLPYRVRLWRTTRHRGSVGADMCCICAGTSMTTARQVDAPLHHRAHCRELRRLRRDRYSPLNAQGARSKAEIVSSLSRVETSRHTGASHGPGGAPARPNGFLRARHPGPRGIPTGPAFRLATRRMSAARSGSPAASPAGGQARERVRPTDTEAGRIPGGMRPASAYPGRAEPARAHARTGSIRARKSKRKVGFHRPSADLVQTNRRAGAGISARRARPITYLRISDRRTYCMMPPLR